jgi:hypothetical protein
MMLKRKEEGREREREREREKNRWLYHIMLLFILFQRYVERRK